jgi:hypothetical protein
MRRLVSRSRIAMGDLADSQSASNEQLGQNAIDPPGWLGKDSSASFLVR